MYPLLLIPLLALIYYIYKRLRGPSYTPGSVSRASTRHPEQFDNPTLHNQTTDTLWHMPDAIHIHHHTILSPSPSPIHALCIHGGPAIAPAAPWKIAHDPSLTPHLTFHFFHQRGCGLSTRPFHQYPTKRFYPGCVQLEQVLGLGAQIADIERIRRRLGVQRLALIGHSFGGLVATLYAAEFPHHVSSLVLLTPASMLCMPQKGFDMFKAMRDRMTTEEDKHALDRFVKEYFAFGNLPNLNEASAAKLHTQFGEQFMKACPDMFVGGELKQGAVGGWAAYATYLSLGIEYDYRKVLKDMLREAQFRTMVVNGGDDLVPIEEGEPYVALFPDGKVVHKVIKGGHFLPDEVPAELAATIKGVLLSTPTD